MRNWLVNICYDGDNKVVVDLYNEDSGEWNTLTTPFETANEAVEWCNHIKNITLFNDIPM